MMGTTLLLDELEIFVDDSCLKAMLKQESEMSSSAWAWDAFRRLPYVQSPYRPQVATFHIGTKYLLAASLASPQFQRISTWEERNKHTLIMYSILHYLDYVSHPT